MKIILIAVLALALTTSATAKSPSTLNASQARIAAYTAAQGYFGDLFDSRVRLGQGRRLSGQTFVFPGRIGRLGGYVNCTFRLYVRATPATYKFRARALRCA